MTVLIVVFVAVWLATFTLALSMCRCAAWADERLRHDRYGRRIIANRRWEG